MMTAKATKVCKWKYQEGGFVFEYDTAQELAKLMFEKLHEVINPYDPAGTDFDNFNETLWQLQRDKDGE